MTTVAGGKSLQRTTYTRHPLLASAVGRPRNGAQARAPILTRAASSRLSSSSTTTGGQVTTGPGLEAEQPGAEQQQPRPEAEQPGAAGAELPGERRWRRHRYPVSGVRWSWLFFSDPILSSGLLCVGIA
jgi:hypothetical protein